MEGKVLRVIVAGSVDWPYPLVVHRALRMCADTAKERGVQLSVAHGAAKQGAEAAADDWTTIASVSKWLTVDPPERWPVRWTGPCRRACKPGHRRLNSEGHTVCPSAAFLRTDDMLAPGADLVLAFIAIDKHPEHCVRLAARRGIACQEFTP